MKKLMILALAMTVFGMGAYAQDADRDELIKRATDRMREPLEITDDDEWAIVSERLAAIVKLRLERGGGRGGNFGPGGRGGRGGPGGRPGDREGVQGRGDGEGQPQGRRGGRRGRGGRDGGDRERGGAENRDGDDRGGQRGPRGQGGPGGRERGGPQGPSLDPDSTRGKLQAAIDERASSNEIKRLLGTLRSERDENERKMEKAQAALREVVTTRQEAVLVMARFLD